jgi:hydrophobic/amphiphilic exporter-1 (mainly G- bacteria), HAE1 family
VRGVTGQMYKQFALAVVFSIGMSLVMALTVVPMFASRMIREEAAIGAEGSALGREELALAEVGRPTPGRAPSVWSRLFDWSGQWFAELDESYRRALQWALRHRAVTILIALATLGLSLLLYPMIGTELMPTTDSGDFNVFYKLPTGTALAVTDGQSRTMEQRLRGIRGVQTVFATVGTSGFGNRTQPNQAQLTVRMASGEGERPTADAMRDGRRQVGSLPGEVRISQFDLVSRLLTGGDNLELQIYGRDTAALARIARDVMERIRPIPGLSNLDVSWQPGTPELRVVVDRAKAASLGLSFADIADTVETATDGAIPTYYEENGSQYRFRVQAIASQRATPEALERLLLRSGATQLTSQLALPRGSQIRLSQVAKIETGGGPSEISRINRERYVAITGVPVDRPAGDVIAEIDARLAGYPLPAGYHFRWGGAQEQMARNFGDLTLAVALAIMLIYMVLAAQFESLVHPFTIMFSVPLAVVGVMLALFLSGRSFGMTAFIGLLMLVGIVVKNAILLVDYTNVLREKGIARDAAVLQAGPTRLRPILMTTGATILGMFPLALGFGKGTETQAPMATAVIGGLITSTMLTLLVIPVVYTMLDDLVGRFWDQGPRLTKRAPAPEPEERAAYPLRDLSYPDPARDPVRRMEGDPAGGG